MTDAWTTAGSFKVDGKEDNPPFSKHMAGPGPEVDAGAAERGSNPTLLFLGSTLVA